MTFQAAATLWHRTNVARYKGATAVKYENLLRSHILPELGARQLEEINTLLLADFMNAKLHCGRLDHSGGLSSSYVRSMMLLVLDIMEFAAAEGLCPPVKTTLQTPAANRREVVILDTDALRRLETYLLAKPDITGTGILISLHTGLRISEVCALRWEDIDFRKAVLHVRSTVARVRGTDGGTATRLIIDTPKTKSSLRDSSIRGFGLLDSIIKDDTITEVMINGPENVFIEQNGRLFKLDKQFESQRKLEDIIQRIVGLAGREVNQANPICDTRLPDGSRVNVVLPPIALCGPTVTIRKFSKTPMTIAKLIEYGSLTQEIADKLQMLVEAKYNIFISGGTGSGKTTFLNALSNYIPKDERVITIEDSAELQIEGIENLVSLETRNANASGAGQITIRDLIKSSLRMRPERIIVGEVRGGEALDTVRRIRPCTISRRRRRRVSPSRRPLNQASPQRPKGPPISRQRARVLRFRVWSKGAAHRALRSPDSRPRSCSR